MRKPALIVLSGGLDSAYNLACAVRDARASFALSFDYGQRASEKELAAARALSQFYGVEWKSLDLRWLGEIHPGALTRSERSMPSLGLHELDDKDLTQKSKNAVWVANRNGVFLNVAAAFAEARDCSTILTGFNQEEAATFPDNSCGYLEALNKCFTYSTQNQVTVESYCLSMTKQEILRAALAVQLPLDLVWSCYQGGHDRCWSCESCKRTERALRAQGEEGLRWLMRLGGKA